MLVTGQISCHWISRPFSPNCVHMKKISGLLLLRYSNNAMQRMPFPGKLERRQGRHQGQLVKHSDEPKVDHNPRLGDASSGSSFHEEQKERTVNGFRPGAGNC